MTLPLHQRLLARSAEVPSASPIGVRVSEDVKIITADFRLPGMPTSIATLARSGAVAGVIKLGSAALAFLMFIAIALVTDARQFGLFGAAFAGASLVSFFSTIGQQSVVLRFWPQYASAADLPTAQSFMERSLLVAGTGVVVGSVGLVVLGLLPVAGEFTPEWLYLCFAASLLALALGWSEMASAALRAKGALMAALLPRDIVWRALVVATTMALFALKLELSAVEATLLCGGMLLLSVVPQTITLIQDTASAERMPLAAGQRAEFLHVTTGLWGVTSLPPALSQVSTLLAAGILGPEIAGGVFVAERTARLVEVAQNGINQVLAPEISAAFHSGKIGHVQRISSLTAFAGTVISILALVVFGTMGEFILGIFDPAYATPAIVWVLLIFGAGFGLGCACGPVGVLLQLTGAQHALLRLLIIGYPIGLLAMALMAYQWGPIGASIGSAGTWSSVCIAAVVVAKHRLDVDPSVLGLLVRFARR